jgi:hypothetical protein
MVKKSLTAVIVMLFITMPLNNAFSQESTTNSRFDNYYKWGIVLGPAIYDRATISQDYGSYTFKNRPIWSYDIGLEYDLYPDKKWSFTTGLWINKEPVYNIKYRILQKDLYSHFTEDLEDYAIGYAIHTFSVPMLLRFNLRASENIYLNFYSGLKAMYFPPGSSDYGLSISSLELKETREIFGLRMESQDFSYYGSFVIGAGATFLRKKVLLKAKVIYVMNFQNTVDGEYQFGNMFSSPPAHGTYNLTGNYLGFLLTANLKKSKNPLIKFKLKF